MDSKEKKVLEDKVDLQESEVAIEQEEEGNSWYAIFPRNSFHKYMLNLPLVSPHIATVCNSKSLSQSPMSANPRFAS